MDIVGLLKRPLSLKAPKKLRKGVPGAERRGPGAEKAQERVKNEPTTRQKT